MGTHRKIEKQDNDVHDETDIIPSLPLSLDTSAFTINTETTVLDMNMENLNMDISKDLIEEIDIMYPLCLWLWRD